jgi:hypothetical protein
MKKISFLFTIAILLFNINQSLASYLSPLPKGKHNITNDSAGHDYQHKNSFSIDLQAAIVSKQEETKITQARCWSYGAPILASKKGKVIEVVRLSRRHTDKLNYGVHVKIKHEDGNTGIYAHMINDSNSIYVKKNDEVEAGQIIGLMGDTGYVSKGNEHNPCKHDNNYGTHLHFEVNNSITNIDGNSSLKTHQILHSKTRPIDEDSLYANNHFGKHPYIPEIEQVHSISPLVAKPGSRTQFLLKGKYFYKDSEFTLPFCESQQITTINQQLIEIDCETKQVENTFETSFPNYYQPNGELLVNFHLTHDIDELKVEDLSFIPAHPGEMLELSITGSGLNSELDISVQAQSDPSKNGSCNFEDQFSYLSPTKIIARCQLPLNLGPVEQDNKQQLTITISSNNQTLYQDQLEINYGISSPLLSPLQATYNIPTRFTITGKNVHRSSIFFIENCQQNSFQIIEQLYNKVIFECLITPKTDDTSSHQFFFKTRSRYAKSGQLELSEEEDKANIILSGYLTVIHDEETRIDSISPSEAIIGQETLFTVTGNRLPYSDDKIPLIWMENCQGNSSNASVEVIPESYTHDHFQFRCTPLFSPEEQTLYLQLEKKYETDVIKEKKALWKEFDMFFKKLKTKKLHIKTAHKHSSELLSEQSVHFVSSLYDFIREEEQFQFQFLREDGLYQISGPPEVTEISVGSISRTNRHQTIHINGQNLPYDLKIRSKDCAQVSISYGSSEKFDAICLLKKVALQELQIIDSKKEKLLESYQSELVEVYEIQANWEDQEKIQLDIRGVNLLQKLKTTSPDCDELDYDLDPSSSQILMSCQIKLGQFSKPEFIKLLIKSEDNITLWNKSIRIQSAPRFSTLDARPLTTNYRPPTKNKLSTASSLQPQASSKRFALYPDISSPILRKAVTKLTQQGLISGFDDNSFQAGKKYSDQSKSQFISELVKTLPYYLEPTDLTVTLNQYSDLSLNQKNLAEITFALLNNIIPKTSQFNPEDPISRGEAALILHKSQQLLAHQYPSPEKEREELARAEG